jgi:hypothetical protein
MASIWKDLLFLHGHFTRPEDLLDAAVDEAANAVALREASSARQAPALDDASLACGGCR